MNIEGLFSGVRDQGQTGDFR